jgi:hypothetical protein
MISYKHYFFHDSHVLLTQAFAASTTSSTVGDGGLPRGSTELDEETGHNCKMTPEEFQEFGLLVLGLDTHSSLFEPRKHSHGFKQTDGSLLNLLLNGFAVITNLHPVIHHNIKGDRSSLACALARCTLLPPYRSRGTHPQNNPKSLGSKRHSKMQSRRATRRPCTNPTAPYLPICSHHKRISSMDDD